MVAPRLLPIGARPREAREHLRLSHDQVAERVSIAPYCRLWKKGRRSRGLRPLVAIAGALGVFLDWLCGRGANSPAGAGQIWGIGVTTPASASDNPITDLLSAGEGKAPMDEEGPPGSSWEYVARQLAVAVRVTAQAQADEAAANREQAAANHALVNAMTTNQETMPQWWAARPPHAPTLARPTAGDEQ